MLTFLSVSTRPSPSSSTPSTIRNGERCGSRRSSLARSGEEESPFTARWLPGDTRALAYGASAVRFFRAAGLRPSTAGRLRSRPRPSRIGRERAGFDVHRIVGADNLLGDVGRGDAPQQAALLHHHGIAGPFAQLADHGSEITHDRGGGLGILLMQLIALVLHVILEGAHPFGEVVFEVLTLVGRHQHALLIEFVL